MGVTGAVTLVRELRAAVETFAAREQDLATGGLTRLAQERRRREQTLAEGTAESERLMAEALAAKQAADQGLAARYQRRKAWIARARGTSKEQGIARVERQLGAKKFQLQKRMLQAEREREAALAEAAAAHAEFVGRLQAERTVLAGVEAAALRALRPFGAFVRRLDPAVTPAPPAAPGDHHEQLARAQAQAAQTLADTHAFRGRLTTVAVRLMVLWGLLSLTPLGVLLGGLALHAGTGRLDWPTAGGVAVGGFVLMGLLQWLGRARGTALAGQIVNGLARCRGLCAAAHDLNETAFRDANARARERFAALSGAIDEELKAALDQASTERVACRMRADEKTMRVAADCEAAQRVAQARLNDAHERLLAGLTGAADERRRALESEGTALEARWAADAAVRWESLAAEWRATITPLHAACVAAGERARALFPPWGAAGWSAWRPPAQFASAVPFGRLEIDVARLAGVLPRDPRLALPGPAKWEIPLLLTYPEAGSLLVEAPAAQRERAADLLNSVILRLLTVTPSGRVQFTILDPVGLGQNFAGVMHLADHEEQLINYRIWTQPAQIEEKLAELSAHMEKVIQMYLRNDYASIAEFNEQAGEIAEKFHFLVVADFPVNFSEAALRRLESIAANGARCGVYTLIHWDRRPVAPGAAPEPPAEELRRAGAVVGWKGAEPQLTALALPGVTFLPDAPPGAEWAAELVHRVGRASKDSGRVEVPFAQVVPTPAEIWSLDTSAELRVPIGRTGATKLQYLALGKGTRQHGLIAGKTGSGKSTLFHVIITNLALWCSPAQVEFYLVDFKKGVEFKCYGARALPHARVVAIASDREFGLSVLARVDEELQRRGEKFRELGVQDLPGFFRAGGQGPMPRTLLMIDEFQELFVEDDKISQSASVLLDRIVRQGRAFGIHVLLGSQTLGGAYTVARATMGQMVVRIALQCNEADAYLIMDDSNPAPRLLSRPGEGIYNDAAGALAGNSPFQTVWLSDEIRDRYLDQVITQAQRTGLTYPKPIVFEGDAPADVAENPLLAAALARTPATAPLEPRIWLGAPNSIKGPTEALFHRQAGNHLLLVGQRDEAILAIFTVALVGLAAQYPPGGVRLVFCHGTPSGTPARDYLDGVLRRLGQPVTVAKGGELPEVLARLAADLQCQAAEEGGSAPVPTFLFFHGLPRHPKLRYEEDFGFGTPDPDAPPNPAALLNQIICEGATQGCHVVASFDTYNNVNRFLSKKAFSEFEMRVVFQMSANDSASLIDSPKANDLGLHRALFYNEQQGYLEVFRPYAVPPADWLAQHAFPAR